MATINVDFEPNFRQLERDLKRGDFTTEVDVETRGGGGGTALGAGAGAGAARGGAAARAGAAGGVGGLLGSMNVALLAIAAAVLSLEPIQQILGFLLRQVELFIVPVVSALKPVLQLIQQLAIGVIRFFRDPSAFADTLGNALQQGTARLLNVFISAFNAIPILPDIPTLDIPGDGGPPSATDISRQGTRTSNRRTATPPGGLFGVIAELLPEPFLSDLRDDAKVEKIGVINEAATENIV